MYVYLLILWVEEEAHFCRGIICRHGVDIHIQTDVNKLANREIEKDKETGGKRGGKGG